MVKPPNGFDPYLSVQLAPKFVASLKAVCNLSFFFSPSFFSFMCQRTISFFSENTFLCSSRMLSQSLFISSSVGKTFLLLPVFHNSMSISSRPCPFCKILHFATTTWRFVHLVVLVSSAVHLNCCLLYHQDLVKQFLAEVFPVLKTPENACFLLWLMYTILKSPSTTYVLYLVPENISSHYSLLNIFLMIICKGYYSLSDDAKNYFPILTTTNGDSRTSLNLPAYSTHYSLHFPTQPCHSLTFLLAYWQSSDTSF